MNGLQYVVSCQSQFTRKTNDEIVQNEFERISKSIKNCLGNNQMSITDERAKTAFTELERIIHDLYTKPLSPTLHRRAQCEWKTLKRLQRLLRIRSDIIIRPIDKGKSFYIGSRATMERKTQEYMEKTAAYQEITDGHRPLADSLSSVRALELAHLYTLPKVHKVGIPPRPIVAGINAPTALISIFLNDLLAPIYLCEARKTTFINSMDFVRQLESYAENGNLTSMTKFIIMDAENLYTMIPKQGALEALLRFLERHVKYRKIGPFNIHCIMKMARVILDNNYFVYNNKYYKQIRGGAMGSAFTQVLANIYMLEWEQELIEYQKSHGEIYGRFMDDIFMTTNQTIAEITVQLEKARTKDINIKVEPKISTSVNFLDVVIINDNGKQRTTIYHKPTAEPYYLPYTSDHSHQIHRTIPYNALLRAARLCSTVQDFNTERLRTTIALLLNNYPAKLISNQFLRFFQVNRAENLLTQLEQSSYQQLHQKLLSHETQQDIKLKSLNKDNLVLHPPALQKSTSWNPRIIYATYTYEKGPIQTLPQQIYDWWKRHYLYQGSPANRITIRLAPKTNLTLRNLLVRKKPPRTILANL